MRDRFDRAWIVLLLFGMCGPTGPVLKQMLSLNRGIDVDEGKRPQARGRNRVPNVQPPETIRDAVVLRSGTGRPPRRDPSGVRTDRGIDPRPRPHVPPAVRPSSVPPLRC